MSVAEIWRRDLVHPKEEVYDTLADGVVAVERSCTGSNMKRKRRDSEGDTSWSTYERPGTWELGHRDADRYRTGGYGGSSRGGTGGRGGSRYGNQSARGRSDG